MRYVSRSLTVLATLAAGPLLSQDVVGLVEENTVLLEAGDTVPVSRIPDGVYLRSVDDPDDNIWERLPVYRVNVAPAPAVHPSVDLRVNYDAPAHPLYVTLARTSERLYVRMRWRDDTRDDVTLRDQFRDGAAVQFSLGDDNTPYMMGYGTQQAVNIWYWRSDTGQVQDLAAGGPGSTTLLDDQPVSGDSLYRENRSDPNEWTVVMSRPIGVSGDFDVSFRRAQVPMAFALWQGSDGERDGLKSVSDGWIFLEMGDE